MGTWGDGIYDNDSALDELADLLVIAEPGDDVPALVARIGLLAWLHPVSVTHGEGVRELVAGIDARGLAELPEATQQALRSLVDDPATHVQQQCGFLGQRLRRAPDINEVDKCDHHQEQDV